MHLFFRFICDLNTINFFGQLQKDTKKHKQAFYSEHMSTWENLNHLIDKNIFFNFSFPLLLAIDQYISAIFSIDWTILIKLKIEVNMALY